MPFISFTIGRALNNKPASDDFIAKFCLYLERQKVA